MRTVEIDINVLSSQISQLEDTLSRTQAALDNLTDRVESLQSMWNGPGHDKFNEQYELDRQHMQNMCQIIRNIIDGMEQARLLYTQCESEVDNAVASIQF